MTTTRWQVRCAEPVAFAEAAAVLGRAFTDDPLCCWLLQRDDADERTTRLRRFFEALVGFHGRHGLVWMAEAGAGAAVWTPPPDGWRIGVFDEARLALPMLGIFGAGSIVRLLQVQAGMGRVHVREPHYYLFSIGIDPAMQGRGVGAALLAPMLERCDGERMPAYLESSNPANLPFYRRLGFEATSELSFGGNLVTAMRRAPR